MGTRKNSETIPIPRRSSGANRSFVIPRSFLCLCLLLAATATPLRAQEPAAAAAGSELEPLARALRRSGSSADAARLRIFAARHANDALGPRAALALGDHAYRKQRHADAVAWFDRAAGDRRLRDHALYGGALARRALGQNAQALRRLERLQQEFPESVMGDQAARALAEAAVAAGRPRRALEVLAGLPRVEVDPPLLLLRARAYEATGQLRLAAADYAAVHSLFPLSDEAKPAAARLRALGKGRAAVPVEQRLARAEALFAARRWREARAEFAGIASQQGGAPGERVELRLIQCRLQLRRATPAALAALTLTDPELEAERLYALSQAYRSRGQPAEMLDAVERVAARWPQSPWAEEALFAAGNFFWLALDRERAAEYYRRLREAFPGGRHGVTAHWRVAWTAYLARQPEAVARIEEHLREFPGSPFVPNAVYWLGRAAERSGNVPHARSFYRKLVERFRETYFGHRAVERLGVLGDGPANAAPLLGQIPEAPAPPRLDEPIPAAAAERWSRAQALRSIAFDAAAELELRAASAAAPSPRLLLEIAQAAMDAGQVASGISAARRAYPHLEARGLEAGPARVWRLVYPLLYAKSIDAAAQRAALDPMLIAAVIRQESVFEPAALSRAGAVGLMQVLPRTARPLARRLKLRYSRRRLADPEYNLRLGAALLAGLLRRYGSLEAALAAYNGGNHVERWQSGRGYDEPAEFVESIPFRETREYVQNVIRNVDVYRRLYRASP